MRTAGEITSLARALEREHGREPLLVIDDAGVRGGVTDRLRELREFELRAYNAAGRATRPSDYPNRRSEDWFGVAECLPLLDLDPDEELAADLLAPRYALDSQGRRVVEAKAETKRRLRRSPDRADAVVMALSAERPGARAAGITISRPRGGQRVLAPPRFLEPSAYDAAEARVSTRASGYERCAACRARHTYARSLRAERRRRTVTVQELIERLETCNPEAEVRCASDGETIHVLGGMERIVLAVFDGEGRTIIGRLQPEEVWR
jgi:hypothetical protein